MYDPYNRQAYRALLATQKLENWQVFLKLPSTTYVLSVRVDCSVGPHFDRTWFQVPEATRLPQRRRHATANPVPDVTSLIRDGPVVLGSGISHHIQLNTNFKVAMRLPAHRALGARLEKLEPRLVFSGQLWGDFYWGNDQSTAPVLGDEPLVTHLNDVHTATGVTQVRQNYGLRGRGQTVAVIDSGVAYDHLALGGGLGSGYRVVGGWDFTSENDANPYDDGPAGFHGTHVAGIIGSDDASYTGVAPQVDLVALRVFDDNGAGYFSWVERALSWVHDNRLSFDNPITTVNLSLGTDFNSNSLPGWANLEDEFAQLVDDGVVITVSAGNSYQQYNSQGLSYPAVSPLVIPVASVDANGQISSFSQRNHRVLAAPGERIASTVPDHVFGADGVANDFGSASGTSMAAPYVAGASVLLREAMQIVGHHQVNQQTIYDLLRSTADMVYDSATSSSYHRINVQRALDHWMPADDHGNDAQSASSLGTLTDTLDVSGLIGRLDDVDAFAFTAGFSGRVTLSTTAEHYLTPQWTVSTASEFGPDSLSFDVVAGQQYTVQLATGDGIGRYQTNLELEPAIVDLGSVAWNTFSDLALHADSWFRWQAVRDGLVTAIISVDPSTSVTVEVFDANQQLLGSAGSSDGLARVDVQAAEGQTLLLRVRRTGETAEVGSIDLQIANVVHTAGQSITVWGTDGDDRFVFNAAHPGWFTINGVQYQFDAASVSSLSFQGQQGQDTAELYGSAADDVATLGPLSGQLDGPGYSIAVNDVESIRVHAGGGHNRVTLLDSAGNDDFYGRTGDSVMMGAGYANQVFGFQRVDAYASTGQDRAMLYDSAGNDQFYGRPQISWLQSDLCMNVAHQFDRVQAYSTQGGSDRAWFYDSAGDDLFFARPDYSYMAGNGYVNLAYGFARVDAYGSAGGNDTARMYDSPGNELFYGRPTYSWMVGNGFSYVANAFDRVFAYATAGGEDHARMYDTAGNEQFYGRPGYSWMMGDGFAYVAYQFDRVYSYANSGGYDRAWLYDSPNDDQFYGQPTASWMMGPGYSNVVYHFDRVYATATAGGNDVARLYDSVGNDQYYARTGESWMRGDGYLNLARGFRRVWAYASQGDDQAEFEDLVDGETFTGRANEAYRGGGTWNQWARGFDWVTARVRAEHRATLLLDSIDYLFEQYGQWDMAAEAS